MSTHRPNIVVLDGYTLNPGDLSWSRLKALGHTTIYEHSKPEEIISRAREADIILSNKAVLDAAILPQLPRLRCIVMMATGYNNIDVKAARKQGISVSNALGYGSDSVAQHVFALLLELTNQVGRHHESVLNGDWSRCRDFSYTLQPILGLVGQTLGIYGFGKIGQKVAEIGQAFGMQVIAHHKHPERDARPGVAFVDLVQLFTRADVLTLHAPLTDQNRELINKERLQQMKTGAMLINTGRGGLVQEKDLKEALENGLIAGAALDVLSTEPPPPDHLLYGAPNCLITPHQAWASKQAREKLMGICIENVQAFMKGEPQNVVN